MDEIFGRTYYIDLDAITERCRIDNTPKPKKRSQKVEDLQEDEAAINIFKYELLKMCLERVLSEFNDNQENIGGISMNNNNTISFKIAFNTLIKNQILIEIDDE